MSADEHLEQMDLEKLDVSGYLIEASKRSNTLE